MAFLVTSSNSFPLPISIALHLSGLSFSQPELIQAPISEGQNDSDDAAISPLVTCGAGGEGADRREGARVEDHWLGSQDRSLLCPRQACFSIRLTVLFILM